MPSVETPLANGNGPSIDGPTAAAPSFISWTARMNRNIAGRKSRSFFARYHGERSTSNGPEVDVVPCLVRLDWGTQNSPSISTSCRSCLRGPVRLLVASPSRVSLRRRKGPQRAAWASFPRAPRPPVVSGQLQSEGNSAPGQGQRPSAKTCDMCAILVTSRTGTVRSLDTGGDRPVSLGPSRRPDHRRRRTHGTADRSAASDRPRRTSFG